MKKKSTEAFLMINTIIEKDADRYRFLRAFGHKHPELWGLRWNELDMAIDKLLEQLDG